MSALQYAGVYTYKLTAPEFERIVVDWRNKQAAAAGRFDATGLAPAKRTLWVERVVDEEYASETRRILRSVSWDSIAASLPYRYAYLWSTSSYVGSDEHPLLYRVVKLQHYLFVLLAALGLWMRRHATPVEWPLWTPILYVTLLHTVFHVEARYSIPARSFLIAYASVPLVAALRRVAPSFPIVGNQVTSSS
jgi:hypothetical protein